jgi:hypothetical protein
VRLMERFIWYSDQCYGQHRIAAADGIGGRIRI